MPTINIYKKSNTIIADNSSGLDDSSIILKASGERSYLFDFKPVTDYDVLVAKNEGIAVIEDLENNEFRAIVFMEAFPDRLLYVTRNVDGEVLSLLDQTKETVILYDKIEKERGQLLFEFGQLYLGFSIVLILSAVWFALWIAERLTKPVSNLVAAVAKVADGDLTVEVSEEKAKMRSLFSVKYLIK